MEKFCSKCNVLKPASEFYFSQKKRRISSYCKECEKKKFRDWYHNLSKTNLEARKEYTRRKNISYHKKRALKKEGELYEKLMKNHGIYEREDLS